MLASAHQADPDTPAAAATRTAHPHAGDGCGMYVLITRCPLSGKAVFIETTTGPDRIDHLVGSDLWYFLAFPLARETREDGHSTQRPCSPSIPT
jgi:hypothetical protein